MNASTTFSPNNTPDNGAMGIPASQPNGPCRCRIGVQVSQTLIHTRLAVALRRLDDIDTALTSNQLSDWTGDAAEEYRNRLSLLARQSALLRDGISATSRLLWSAGAA